AASGAPLVAVSDALYHHPDRRPLQDLVTCLRDGCRSADDGHRLDANAALHLKPPQQSNQPPDGAGGGG
ncbi:hypothetical protein, partial [Methylobacterium radiotolerans]|uniref:hypothetical protein n=1 Tax=Methylobacterium radiotolerans TaxID=31998 RepID=UPI000B924FC3